MEMLNMCPNCFKQCGTGSVICPHCGFDISGYNHKSSALPVFTTLNNQYLVGKVLGQGGFGITYKALDTFKNQVVAIKEYMPCDYAERKGKTLCAISNNKAQKIFEHGKFSYIDEIKTLYQFENVPGIVTIYTHFQENNTVYLVMEYLEGCSLKSYVKQQGGKLDIATARNYIGDVAIALEKVHNAKVLHRDISPENIYLINNANDVRLIDFGAARQYIENSEEEKSVLLKPGFAPPEQYSRTGNQGPWTDVYALAATLYYIVSGKLAPDSMSRMQNDTLESLDKFVNGVTLSMSNAVRKAMEIDCEKRTKSCRQFIDDLDKTGWKTEILHSSIPSGGVPWTPPVVPTPPPPPQPKLICSVNCVSGAFKGGSVMFYPGQRVSVGRKGYSDLAVSEEKFISKQHCIVEFDMNSKCFLVSDISLNGTYMQNGVRLNNGKRTVLPVGSIVFLARQDIIIQFNAFYK